MKLIKEKSMICLTGGCSITDKNLTEFILSIFSFASVKCIRVYLEYRYTDIYLIFMK